MVTTASPSAFLTRLTVAVTFTPSLANVMALTRAGFELAPLKLRALIGTTGLVMFRLTVAGEFAFVAWSAIGPNWTGSGASTVRVKLWEALVMPSLTVIVI